MLKSGIDQDALIEMFSTTSARQTAQLRDAVHTATLKALQGREMSLKNIRSVLKSVTEAASTGTAGRGLPEVDAEAMLGSALSGMDDALLKAVEAHQVALSSLAGQGVGLQDKQLKKALGDLEQLEDTMFGAVRKAAEAAGGTLSGPWEQALSHFKQDGSQAGAHAQATVNGVTAQLEKMQTAMRDTRAAGLKAAQALAQSYTALVSGVLMGMSDALRQGGSAGSPPPPTAAPAAPAAKSARRKAT
ncbi:MAG TPA: DUF6781 family protein [Ideonella sp.]|uniref:DUF6781 family protein n=1 Tax=Ideonella sp. TaxID=1929293 RepID=UPI002CB4DC03|nr:DUF6781 family protein [Ideonella sp.]HSI49366.1 DUF6781 family protein [Ideonella sp.]